MNETICISLQLNPKEKILVQNQLREIFPNPNFVDSPDENTILFIVSQYEISTITHIPFFTITPFCLKQIIEKKIDIFSLISQKKVLVNLFLFQKRIQISQPLKKKNPNIIDMIERMGGEVVSMNPDYFLSDEHKTSKQKILHS